MSDETNTPENSTGDAPPPQLEPPAAAVSPDQPAPGTPPIGLQPPPATMPPPGYPPNAGYMPPPVYPPPFAGNVPPGGVPPGYPPPYYMPMEFPPPPAYAVPSPYVGFPWEIIPPTPGTLVQAWFTIVPNLSRRNIAAWAQSIRPNWTTWSIGVGVVLAAIAGVINGIRIINFSSQLTTVANGQGIQSFQVFHNIFTGEAIATIILTPLSLIINVFVIPWFWSFFMNPLLGSTRQRFQRAFRPFALIQPLIGAIALSEAIISLVIYTFAPTFAIFAFLLTIPLIVYSTALNIQVGSVGAGLKRWPVFGIQLLAGAAVGFATAIIALIAFFVVFAIQPH